MSIARRVTVRRLLGTGAAVAHPVRRLRRRRLRGLRGHRDARRRRLEVRRTATRRGRARARDRDRPLPVLARRTRTSSTRSASTTRTSSRPRTARSTSRSAPPATRRPARPPWPPTSPTARRFGTSGEQVFVDFDTVTVKPGPDRLASTSRCPDAGCYAQIDLYRGTVKFDGKLDAKDGFDARRPAQGPGPSGHQGQADRGLERRHEGLHGHRAAADAPRRRAAGRRAARPPARRAPRPALRRPRPGATPRRRPRRPPTSGYADPVRLRVDHRARRPRPTAAAATTSPRPARAATRP